MGVRVLYSAARVRTIEQTPSSISVRRVDWRGGSLKGGSFSYTIARMATSKVYPHDPLVELIPDVFFVHGSMRMGPGMVINRNMAVVRHGREITLLNPIRLNAEGEEALEALGTVRHVVRLGPAHGVDDAYSVERFGATFWSLGGDADYSEPKPAELLAEGGPLPIPDARLFVYRETVRPESCFVIDRGAGILLSCDSLQHWVSTSNCSFIAKGVTRLMGFLHPANIGPPWKKLKTKPGGSLRPDFERLLEMDFDSLLGAHGQPLIGGARRALQATIDRVFG